MNRAAANKAAKRAARQKQLDKISAARNRERSALDDDDSTADDSIMAGYSLGISLNTSFTGEDSLDIAIDAGVSGEGVGEFDGVRPDTPVSSR